MTRPDAATVLIEVAQTLAASGQPGPTYTAVDRAMAGLIGHKLFTLMTYDARAGTVERVYSNQPSAYPVGGKKPYGASSLFDQLLQRGEPAIVHDAEGIRRAFVDHALIASLGAAASLHLPVVHDGRALGVMNLLHEAGWYDTPHFDLARPFAALLIAPFLMALGRCRVAA